MSSLYLQMFYHMRVVYILQKPPTASKLVYWKWNFVQNTIAAIWKWLLVEGKILSQHLFLWSTNGFNVERFYGVG